MTECETCAAWKAAHGPIGPQTPDEVAVFVEEARRVDTEIAAHEKKLRQDAEGTIALLKRRLARAHGVVKFMSQGRLDFELPEDTQEIWPLLQLNRVLLAEAVRAGDLLAEQLGLFQRAYAGEARDNVRLRTMLYRVGKRLGIQRAISRAWLGRAERSGPFQAAILRLNDAARNRIAELEAEHKHVAESCVAECEAKIALQDRIAELEARLETAQSNINALGDSWRIPCERAEARIARAVAELETMPPGSPARDRALEALR